jgi:fibronectin-binding autotransporter adhesin
MRHPEVSKRSLLHRLVPAAVLAAGSITLPVGTASGTTYYWDPAGAGSPGGSGTWDDSLPDWSLSSTGGSNVAWPNASPNTDQAVFGAPGGTVLLNQAGHTIFVNGLSFQTNYTLGVGPASGPATLNLSGTSPTIKVGSSNVVINAPLSGANGFTQSGTGTLTLGGDNSRLSGTINIPGTLSLNSASAGSANATWNLQGGSLSFNPALGGMGQTIQLGNLSGSTGTLTNSGTFGSSDLVTFAIGALGTNTTFGGSITDSIAGDRTGLTKVGNPPLGGDPNYQTLTLSGNNTYSGPTTIEGGTLAITGSISKSSSILLTPGGTALYPLGSTLSLAPSASNTNQIGDAAPLTFEGGTLQYRGFAGSSSETVGGINLASGPNTISVSGANLSAASLDQPTGGGTLFVTGVSLGATPTVSPGVPHVFLAARPTLVGSGAITTTDTPTEHNAPIIPFVLGSSSTTSGGTGTSTNRPNTFVTYSPSGGLRPLNPADEFVSVPIAGQNLRTSSQDVVIGSYVSINSLVVEAKLTIWTGVTLDVASGAVLLDNGLGIAAGDANSTLSFGNRDAFITAWADSGSIGPVPQTVAPRLANLTRLILQSELQAKLVLTQGSNTTDTAPTFLESGLISVAQDYNLGYATGNDAITFPVGSSAKLQVTGPQFTSNKGVSLLGNGIIQATQPALFSGLVSGPGSLEATGPGPLTLSNANNTYTGMTVASGVLALQANSNNNIPNSSIILAGAPGSGSGNVLDATGLIAPGGFQIHAGQTLAGFGTVKAPAAGVVIPAGATISGGDGASRTGNLTTIGTQVWAGGGTYAWKIDLTNAGTVGAFNSDKSGTHWDQLSIGALNVASTGSNPFDIQVVGLPGTGTNAFDPAKNYQWVAANVPAAGAVSGNLFASLAVSYSGFENYKLPGTFSAAFDGTSDPGYTDLVISYTATPEPTALMLLAPAAGCLLLRRRRIGSSACVDALR